MRLREERSQRLRRMKGQQTHDYEAATGGKQKNKQENMAKRELNTMKGECSARQCRLVACWRSAEQKVKRPESKNKS